MSPNAIEILLVEDSPGDVRLAKEALRDAEINHQLSVVNDGVEALAFLRRQGRYVDVPEPDFILLDLNMPRVNGWDVLAEIKTDPDLKKIPVVVLTTSDSEADIKKSFDLKANCYITKPVHFEQFATVVGQIQEFWSCLSKQGILPEDLLIGA